MDYQSKLRLVLDVILILRDYHQQRIYLGPAGLRPECLTCSTGLKSNISLGVVEYYDPHDENMSYYAPEYYMKSLKNQRSQKTEWDKNKNQNTKTAESDIWCLGCFICEMFGCNLLKSNSLSEQFFKTCMILGFPSYEEIRDYLPQYDYSQLCRLKIFELTKDKNNIQDLSTLFVKLPPSIVDLIQSCLRWNMHNRISIRKAFDHECFDLLRHESSPKANFPQSPPFVAKSYRASPSKESIQKPPKLNSSSVLKAKSASTKYVSNANFIAPTSKNKSKTKKSQKAEFKTLSVSATINSDDESCSINRATSTSELEVTVDRIVLNAIEYNLEEKNHLDVNINTPSWIHFNKLVHSVNY